MIKMKFIAKFQGSTINLGAFKSFSLIPENRIKYYFFTTFSPKPVFFNSVSNIQMIQKA